MSHLTTVDAGTTPAQKYAQELRQAADFLEQHPDLVGDTHTAVVSLGYAMGDEDRARLLNAVDAFGEDGRLDVGVSMATANLELGDVRLSIGFDRDTYCTPRIEGGQVVYDLHGEVAA